MPVLLIGFCSMVVLNRSWGQTELGPQKDLFRIDNIQVKGVKKVEVEAILEKIRSKVGMTLDNYLLRDDIVSIYGMKYFESVEVHRQVIKGKNHLIFVLVENPIISKISFEGNDEIGDEDLLEQVKTNEYSILNVNKIKSDVKSVGKFYEEKGYYLASADYELKRISKESVEVIYKIKEYEKVRVKKITFLGNSVFSNDELKSIMETREESILSFMSNAGNFKEFNFQTDIERLKYFYKSKGHLQVNVGTPDITISEDKKWVFISLKVTEGPQFTINSILFNGELLFSEEKMFEQIGLKAGHTYSEDLLRKDIQLLTEMYQDEGYAFANVLRTLDIVPGENKVDVNFSFEKGKIAYFGKITVMGNTKTRDKVIRRELKVHEGMRYSGSKLRKSKENVNRLGFFEPSSVVFNSVSPKNKDDVLDLEITVKERNTGQITLGAGYSTASKGFLQASIAQNNFNGMGQRLSFSLSISGTSKSYNLGFDEPYMFDSKWSGGGNVFRTENEASSSYSYVRQGFDTHVGYPIFEYIRAYITYKLQDTELSNVQDQSLDTETENGLASSVQFSIIKDKRNNKFEPTGGHYAQVALEYTGLGGDHRWLRTKADARYYKKLVGDLVFRSRLSISKLYKTTEREIPRNEKFVLGGSRNLRGYGYEDIGPLKKQEKTDPITGTTRQYVFNSGGLFSVVNTLELEHPMVREAGLKWVVFFDAGNVAEKYYGENDKYSLRTDYGFGFRWFSPIGVLRFEFGFPIDRRGREAPNQFYFDIGQLF